MLFRKATLSDLNSVCQLYRTASQSPYSVWDETYPTFRDAAHDIETENLFVLAEKDIIIGTVSIVPESEMEDMNVWQYPSHSHREIARIAISPAHQGKGLAAQMISGVFEILKKRGYESIRLSAACCNLPACRTYQKLGFAVRGDADLYDSRYYLMEKKL